MQQYLQILKKRIIQILKKKGDVSHKFSFFKITLVLYFCFCKLERVELSYLTERSW